MGYGFHPLAAWLANTAESLAMLLRPGNAGSNTFADHAAVLTAAIRQIPSRMRSRLLVRVDGGGGGQPDRLLISLGDGPAAGEQHGAAPGGQRQQMLNQLVAGAGWQAAVDQDGTVQEDKRRRWPQGLRWIVRRTRPSRRQAKNLTAFEKATGWRYSIIVTNVPVAGGIGGGRSPDTARRSPTRTH